MRPAAALLALTLSALALPAQTLATAQASSVQLQVESRPGLTFNREVPSVVRLTTPWGTQTVKLNRGAPYSADPQHYWSSLTPVVVRLRTPPGLAAGRYPVSAQTDLYVCDQTIHLCSVRSASAQGELEVDAVAPRLTLTLKVPNLRGF